MYRWICHDKTGLCPLDVELAQPFDSLVLNFHNKKL